MRFRFPRGLPWRRRAEAFALRETAYASATRETLPHMTQNIYGDPAFFEGYSRLHRSVQGLDGALRQ